MEEEAGVGVVGIAVNVFDAIGVEGAGSADDAVNKISFGEQEFGQIGTILASDAGNQRFFRGGVFHRSLFRRNVSATAKKLIGQAGRSL